MLRRVAFVGACHLSLHHTASFSCAAAAWVCSSSQLIGRVTLDGNTGTFGKVIRYKPILDILLVVHRGSFFSRTYFFTEISCLWHR